MQPHSMCALAITGYIWNSYDRQIESKYTMRIEYTNKEGEEITKRYEITDVKESTDKLELKMRIMRSGGGLSCTMHSRRSSASEGSKVVMTHETIHISGLREEFKLYKSKISEGMHYNSMRYRGFSGDFELGSKRVKLTCEIKRDDGSYAYSRYDLEID